MLVIIGVAVLLLAVVAFFAWKALSTPPPFLNKKKRSVEIIDIKELSHDTKRFRLSLGSARTPLGLPIGKHIRLFAPNQNNPEAEIRRERSWNGKPCREAGDVIQRSYTPTPSVTNTGFVDVVIKIYRPGQFVMPDGREVTWEDGGKMSRYLDSKQVGDKLEIMGPIGMHEYLGCGQFKVPGKVITSKKYGLLAGGAGITPMLQLVWAALHDPKDTCTFSMIYANKTEHDILCRDLIEEMIESSNGRFRVTYTVDFPPENWGQPGSARLSNNLLTQKTGFITADMIKECLPSPDQQPIILMCGPPPMIEFACKKNLDALGYPADMCAVF